MMVTFGRSFLAWVMITGMACVGASNACAESSTTAQNPPPFKLLPYDENYSYLRDPLQRTDFLDPIKYIALGAGSNSYLTLGGEIRERYEYFHNNLWGRGPQDDDGYFLQRYMIHADAHFGDYFRVFSQFKSSLEDGRSGGPRPTDEDQFDLSQAF